MLYDSLQLLIKFELECISGFFSRGSIVKFFTFLKSNGKERGKEKEALSYFINVACPTESAFI